MPISLERGLLTKTHCHSDHVTQNAMGASRGGGDCCVVEQKKSLTLSKVFRVLGEIAQFARRFCGPEGP